MMMMMIIIKICRHSICVCVCVTRLYRDLWKNKNLKTRESNLICHIDICHYYSRNFYFYFCFYWHWWRWSGEYIIIHPTEQKKKKKFKSNDLVLRKTVKDRITIKMFWIINHQWKKRSGFCFSPKKIYL